jgi:orotate phosphoribosyltransferase
MDGVTDPLAAERDRLQELLASRSILVGDFVLASGRRSSYYIDCRRATMHADGLALIGKLGLVAVRRRGWEPDLVGGLTLGADPVAYAVARASCDAPPLVHAFTVRKAAKTHGAGRRIEGCFEPGAAVVVVEDVITTGGSALEAVRVVREEGGTVLGVLGVVDREEGGRASLEATGLAVEVLFGVHELLRRDA